MHKNSTRGRRGLIGFLRNTAGGIGVTFSLSLPAVMATSGLATDYAMLVRVRVGLQDAADAAAMAGAQEIALARRNGARVTATAEATAAFALTGDAAAGDSHPELANRRIEAVVEDDFSAVEVRITEAWTPVFAHYLMDGVSPVTVHARARVLGGRNLCVLALAERGSGIALDHDAQLTGSDCAMISASSDGDSLSLKSDAAITAATICAAGGADAASGAAISPRALTDCKAAADPLAGQPAPGFGACDHTDLVVRDEARSLAPGVYCGGLTLQGSASVTLAPGIYVIKDGPLHVAGEARLSGSKTGFFLTGREAPVVSFDRGSHIRLSAPASGPMAGLLIHEDRAAPRKVKHRIDSNDARELTGTIYLPAGELAVTSSTPVADQSSYTAIVTQSLELGSAARLVLNADAKSAEVPVPAGLEGTRQVILTQ